MKRENAKKKRKIVFGIKLGFQSVSFDKERIIMVTKKKSVWIKNHLQMNGDKFAIVVAKRKLSIPEMQKAVEDYLKEEHKMVEERFKRSSGLIINYKGK